jgi:tyrosine-protein kinase Etk/Wzc
MQENKQDNLKNLTSSINIREEITRYLIHWKWFVLSTIIFLSLSFLYLRYAIPQYSTSTFIMIKDNQKSGISKELGAFKDLGIIGGSSSNNPENEMVIIKSRYIIGKVLDNLKLSSFYLVEGKFKTTDIYKKNPIKIVFSSDNKRFQERDTVLRISIISNDKFEFRTKENKAISQHLFTDSIKNIFGGFKIEKTDNFKNTRYKDIFIRIINRNSLIDSYKGRVKVELVNKDSSILELSLQGPVKQKAEDFLNELVKQYNLDAVNDKSQVSAKTKEFIEKRLTKIFEELASVQNQVENYKVDNEISGLSRESEITLENASKNYDRIIEIRNELTNVKWVLESLKKQTETPEVLPQNIGLSESTITESISVFNELVLDNKKLLFSAGGKNPRLLQIRTEIRTLRDNLILSVSNLEYSLSAKLNLFENEFLIVKNKVSSIPVLERGILDIAREQEIIAGLYSYLLKKKEETAISLAVTVPNAKIIDVAYGSNSPVAPQGKKIYLLSLFLGLVIPFLAVYIVNVLDTKIHSRKDVEDMTSIPFLGDIPHTKSGKKIVIGSDSRSSISESFRLIRTNLDFILKSSETNKGQIIFITSTTSGEGKSFISINMSAALSLADKKVLLLGLDLRAPKVAKYLGIPERKGVTNFIKDPSLTVSDLKFSVAEIENLDIICSGVIPPNPAELLLTERIKEMFEIVEKEYDYIIVDTAPVNLVSDTLLISEYADLVLYVSRANYLDKRMLIVPETLYKEKKLANMAMILNDTDMSRGYGNGYSYGYGYGYGYGKAYSEEKEKPWYKKIFKSS